LQEVIEMSHHAIQIRRDTSDAPPPTPAFLKDLPGTARTYTWHGHQIHYQRLGAGKPLLLVHSPDVGASSIEWRKNLEPLAEGFSVYAVDLPGYGCSDVLRMRYTADLYIRFIEDFLQNVAGKGAKVVASGLGASYAVHAAVQRPGLIDRMALVAPAGLSAFRPSPLGGLAFGLLGLPGLSSVCGSSIDRTSILEHLQNDIYADDEFAGQSEVEVRYWVSHRKNADCVERSRMAGLHNIDIRGVVPKLKVPTMVVWGRRATRPPVEDTEVWRELLPESTICVFDRSGLCPHEEEPGHFNTVVMDYMMRDQIVQAA
jgi:pimeloyl-ACP methyl ester carboxylesterase